ncbi:MAG TPA: beta-ketoacyl-ACP synthase II [Saprospiraceae bacterium]|nr:beta-ketoacyl-ACP synthase II [Saprospiraceae bacterium]HMQ81273.1 beta-ketoacyl-ACP synthase II [Saprospiraceae bacterium]
MNRVVVTGVGAITPIGNNANEFWSALLAGKNGVGPITKFDAKAFKTRFACEVKNFDPTKYMERPEVRKYDLFTHYALAAVKEALEQAEVNFEQLDRDRIGVIWGSGNGGIETFQNQVLEFGAGGEIPLFNPFFVPKLIVNICPGIIAMKYGLRGINFATVSACASSNMAMIDAFNYIRWGKANMIITGGSEAAITKSAIGGFGALKALSTQNDDYENASRPFDANRNGFVMGEGAGAIILESLEHAQARKAPIFAEIAGAGMAADAYHLTGSHPEGLGAYLGMKAALEDAQIDASKVGYINAHATSTPNGDISELKGIERLFGANKQLSISGTKSMTGHLLGAAGAIEGVAAIKAVETNSIPPTINTQAIDLEFADKFDFVLDKSISKELEYAMSNTFGFGGQIGSVIFKKYAT